MFNGGQGIHARLLLVINNDQPLVAIVQWSLGTALKDQDQAGIAERRPIVLLPIFYRPHTIIENQVASDCRQQVSIRD